jgi:hypothetical protein
MALQDHFRPPLSIWRHWHSFHNGWAAALAAELNKSLPEGWFAETNVHFGIEIDVATLEERARFGDKPLDRPMPASEYFPPAPVQTIPFAPVTAIAEVAIYDSTAGPILAAAIELVSPANKDRPETREAFVSKCANYLREGIGLLIVDIVTERNANLHAELLSKFGESAHLSTELYAAAYRPVEVDGEAKLQIWEEPLELGQPLPVLPLWLRGGPCLPVELDTTYQTTCHAQRISMNGR